MGWQNIVMQQRDGWWKVGEVGEVWEVEEVEGERGLMIMMKDLLMKLCHSYRIIIYF